MRRLSPLANVPGKEITNVAHPRPERRALRVPLPRIQYSSRSVGAMIATPFALATPRFIGAPLAVSSPNLL